MNKSRGGLSKREFALKGTSGTTKVSTPKEAKKSSSSSVSKEYKGLAKAQKEYLSALKPSKEEDIALKTQNDILTRSELQAKDIQDPTKNAVAGVFVDRQIDRLSADTESKTIPLKYQIAALQSNREAKAKLASERYSTISKNITSKSTKSTDPLDTEYKTIRNAKAKAQLDKTTSGKKGGSGGGESKTYLNALATAQKKIMNGTSNREIELQGINTRFKKNLNPTDILPDGYKVKPKAGKGGRSVG